MLSDTSCQKVIEWDDDRTSKIWGEILQHKFFKAFHKDLYIKDLLTVIANKVYEMELEINNSHTSITEDKK